MTEQTPSLSVVHYAITVDARFGDVASVIDAVLGDLGCPPLGEVGVRRRVNGLTADVSETLVTPPDHAFVWYRRQNCDCLVWSKDITLPPTEWVPWVQAEFEARLAPAWESFQAILVEGLTPTSETVTQLVAALGLVVDAGATGSSTNREWSFLRVGSNGWLLTTEEETGAAVRFLFGLEGGSLPMALIAAVLFAREIRQVENTVQLVAEGRVAHLRTWRGTAMPAIGAAAMVLDRAAQHASQALLQGNEEAEDAWNREIEGRLAAARRALNRLALEAGMKVTDIDFVIITALDEERDAVLAKFDGYRKLDKDGVDTHTYFEATVVSEREDKASYRVIITSLAGMGPAMAIAKAQAVVTRWHPRNVLLVGIACGLPEETKHGDVLVARQVADYTLGKQRPDGTREIRWAVFPAGANLLDAAVNVSSRWPDLIKHTRPSPGTPMVRCDVIASGGDVIANDDIIKEYQDDWPKLVGIEMEAGGIASGLHNTVDRPEFLMIKAVSDYGKDKHDAAVKPWRPYACDVAASFAAQVIRSGTGPAAGSA